MATSKTTVKNDTITIKVKKLCDDAQMPTKRDGDVGFDFYASETVSLVPDTAGNKIPTGIAIEMPKGYYMELFMRSSYGAKTALRLSNCVGVIDSSYRGEIKGMFDNHGPSTSIRKGERFMQGIIKKQQFTTF